MRLKIFVSIILLLLLSPMFIVILMSFTSISFYTFPPPGFSLQWYIAFLQDKKWMMSIMNSFQVAIITTIIATVIGTIAAIAIVKLHFKGKQLFMSLMVAPMVIPLVIVGVALYRSFSFIGLSGSITGIVLAHSVLAIPIVFVTVLASLNGMDKNLELAAMGLGTTPLETFFRITVPMIRPALLSSTLFSFLVSFDEVVVTIFLSGPHTQTLPVKMWENLRSQVDPTIAAISTIIITAIVILFFLQGRKSKESNST